MKDLLTSVIYDTLPYLKTREVSLKSGLMLADIKICRLIKEIPEEEPLKEIVDAFNILNDLLKSSMILDETYSKLFDNSKLTILIEKPQFLICAGGFIPKRLQMYQDYYPELVTLLNSIEEEVAANKA